MSINAEPAITAPMHSPTTLSPWLSADRAQRLRLDAALRALDDDDAVRVLVITGSGRAFCAGQDQHESVAMDAAASAQRIDDYMSLYRTVRALRKPLVAWVNGVAAGAGLQIALMCDLRIASTAARIGMTELKVGSVCGSRRMAQKASHPVDHVIQAGVLRPLQAAACSYLVAFGPRAPAPIDAADQIVLKLRIAWLDGTPHPVMPPLDLWSGLRHWCPGGPPPTECQPNCTH